MRVGSLVDMHEVRPRLWLGSIAAARDRRALLKHGMTHVLTLGRALGHHTGVAPEREPPAGGCSGPFGPSEDGDGDGDPFVRMIIGVDDIGDAPIAKHFDVALAFLASALA